MADIRITPATGVISITGSADFQGTGASSILFITGSGNVGIGTTNPSQKFVVSNGSAEVFKVYSTGEIVASTNYIYAAYSAGTSFYSLGAASFRGGIYNDTGTYLTINGGTSNNTYFNGNVGIGTTTPGYKLDVESSSGLIETIRIRNGYIGGSDGSQLLLGNSVNYTNAYFRLNGGGNTSQAGAGSLNIGLTESFPMAFYTANNERMRITSGGDVGIGTGSPATKLNVIGSNSAEGQVYVGNNDATYSAGINFTTSGTNRGFVGWRYTNSTAPFTLAGIHLINFDNSNLVFGTNNLVRAVIDSSGNVGIGTTSPNVTLEANGIIRSDRVGVASQYVQINGGDAAGPFITAAGAAKVLTIQNNSTTSSDIYFDQAVASTYQFKQATVTKMILDASGNVGINTTSPGAKLHVVGDTYIQGTEYIFQSVNSTVGYLYFDHSGTQVWKQGIFNDNTSTFSIGNGGGFTRLFNITNAGNVGINTTSPTEKLHVDGRIMAAGSGYTLNPTAPIFGQYSSTRGYVQVPSNGQFEIWTGGTAEIATFYNNQNVAFFGNVGIGTTSPQERLDVNTNSTGLNVDNTAAIFGNDVGTNQSRDTWIKLRASVATTDLTWAFGTNQSGDFRFNYLGTRATAPTSGTTLVTIKNSGNVGIGTTSPSYPLHVSGSSGGISIYATNDIAAFSDESVKTELQIIDNAIDRIKQINGYTYVRIDDLSNIRRAGVIAQEVQKVLPEVVSENNDGTLNVAYSNMVALLIEGMKEQQSQIDELKQRLDNL